jgi:hypothetical protein
MQLDILQSTAAKEARPEPNAADSISLLPVTNEATRNTTSTRCWRWYPRPWALDLVMTSTGASKYADEYIYAVRLASQCFYHRLQI